MKKSDLFFNVLRLPADFLMLLGAGLATYFFRTEILSFFRPVLFEFNLPILRYFYLVVFVSLLFVGTFAVSGLYSMRSRLGIGEEFFKVLIASSAAILLIIIYIFLRQELFDSRFLVLGGWFFAIVFVSAGRFIVRRAQSISVSKYNFGVHKLILIGNNNNSTKISAEINSNKNSGYRIIEQFSRLEMSKISSVIVKKEVDEVILADPNFPQTDISQLIDLCQERHIVFRIVPVVSQIFSGNYEFELFKGLPLVEIKRTRLEGWGSVIKRVIDILGSVVGLVLFLPLVGLIALFIKWETEGPVFVRLRRVSGKKEFNLLKFRSMVENAEELKPYLAKYNERTDGPLFKMRDDPRITKTGKFIRKYRLDELPQLWNVFLGNISLVGPRPHQPDEIASYQRHHRKVLAIKGGVTGLAQISGSSDLNFEEEVALDSFYIDNWSYWMDAKIIFKTILKMFFDRSAV